jgi:hypothetical protein
MMTKISQNNFFFESFNWAISKFYSKSWTFGFGPNSNVICLPSFAL